LIGVRPFWLVAALAVGALLVRHRRRLPPLLLGAGALAVVGMAVHATGLVALPELDRVLSRLGAALGAWTYLLVAVLSFLEAAAFLGLVLPGETMTVVGGVVAGQGHIDIVALIAVAWGSAFAGDLAGYALGRRLGRPFLVRHGPRFGLAEERVRMVESLFTRHGGKTIFVGRFVGLVRSLSPFLAGAARMPLNRFVPYDVLGSGLQTTLLCLLGFVFWRSLDTVLAVARRGTLALSATVAVLVALGLAVRWLRDPANRARVRAWVAANEDRRAVRLASAVARRVEGPGRFLVDRLTPGGIGLEFTTLLAVASVAGYVLVGYPLVLDEGGPTLGDRRSRAWSAALRTDWLDGVAAALAGLGTVVPVAVAVALVSAWLLVRRHRLEAAVLVAGLALVVGGVELTQGWVERGPLAGSDAARSYPSAVTAYATTWVALAVAVRRALPRWTHKAALLGVALVLTGGIGLATVYRGEQWFSDVAGGLALGLLVYSTVAMVALAVARHREAAAV
jgi:membrane protein DedA with SNARE-associated domain